MANLAYETITDLVAATLEGASATATTDGRPQVFTENQWNGSGQQVPVDRGFDVFLLDTDVGPSTSRTDAAPGTERRCAFAVQVFYANGGLNPRDMTTLMARDSSIIHDTVPRALHGIGCACDTAGRSVIERLLNIDPHGNILSITIPFEAVMLELAET